MFFSAIREGFSIPGLIIRSLRENAARKKSCVEIIRAYGGDKRQYVVFTGPADGARQDKLVCYIHGGGWRNGNAKVFRFVGYFLARHGYATVTAGYRLAPRYVFPCQADDVLAALACGLEISQENGGPAGKIIMMGHSAGAQLAALTAMDHSVKKRVTDVVSISGPLNFDECRNRYIKKLISGFVPDRDAYDKANPIRRLSAAGKNGLPRFLCVHGDKDPVVEKENSISFVAKANEVDGGKAKLMMIKNGLHSNLIGLFFSDLPPVMEILRWMEQT